jgi:hypothetical protein
MDFLNPTAEQFALYIRFWIDFLYPPAKTLKEVEGAGEIQPQLIIFLAIGLLLSWIVGHMSFFFGLPNDSSPIFQGVSNLAYDDIPSLGFSVLLVIVIASALFHALMRLYVSFWDWANLRLGANPPSEALHGNVFDTINGAVGFGAFFAPLSVLLFVSALLVAKHNYLYVSIFIIVLTVLLFYVYFMSALARTHKETSAFHVFLIFCVSVGPILVFAIGPMGSNPSSTTGLISSISSVR